MSYNLGEVAPLGVTVTDAAGQPADAGTMTVNITRPDGTTVSQPVTSSPTGTYAYDYATVQPGRHVVRWVATSPNAGAWTDILDVADADPGQIISLADAKRQLNITSAAHDAELADMLRSVTAVCERYRGAIVRRTHTETMTAPHGCGQVVLAYRPVLSVTSVTEAGTVLTADGYDLSAGSGVLTRMTGGHPSRWHGGHNTITVVYVAGRTDIDPAVRQAALILLQHMWETQRGTGIGQRDTDTFDPRYAYSIPRRALELLGEPEPEFA